LEIEHHRRNSKPEHRQCCIRNKMSAVARPRTATQPPAHSQRKAPKNDPIDLNEGDLVEGDERREKEEEMKENRNPKQQAAMGGACDV
jgi:hypothetical protein